jgi:hypothetical protein
MPAGEIARRSLVALAAVLLLGAGVAFLSAPKPASAQEGFQTMNWCVDEDQNRSGVVIVSSCSSNVNVAWCSEGEDDYGMCGDQQFRYENGVPPGGRRTLTSEDVRVYMLACEHPRQPQDLEFLGQQMVGRCI